MEMYANLAEGRPPAVKPSRLDDGSLVTRRREFERYASSKTAEIDEFRLAHRYYSGVQWSAEEVKILRARKQPIITFNRIQRKVDGVLGTVRRLRNDPKAYPRSQGQDQAAELATQVIRYICDASDFENLEAEALIQAAIIGYGGLELEIREARTGDYDIGMLPVDSRTFFYDPRSVKWDFSDARYMGTYKWASPEEIDEIAPGFGPLVSGSEDGTFSTQAETERDRNWTDELGRVKLVDHWYIQDGMWKWCLHTGGMKISSGDSPFYDENGRSICKFRMWSAYVDHEGDRYGLVRNMKGPQDAMNQHRSKAMHIMNTRQVKARRGAIQDVDAFRKQAAASDGVMLYDGAPEEVEILQPSQEFLQQTQYFQDAKDEIENFGPNQALLGTEMKASSGRAIAMMQQSGLAELGPFLKNYRMWRLDIYKAVWGAAKAFWKAERWLRVTGDEKVSQFIQLNQDAVDEYGMPIVVNQIGAIDVDISISEGPDTENVMGDVFDTLQAIGSNGVPVPPAAIIEMSSLPSSVKEKLVQMMQPQPAPPDPALMQAEMARREELQVGMAKEEQKANLELQKMQMEMATEQQNAALEREKLQIELASKEQSALLDREKMAQDRELKMMDRELKLIELAQAREIALMSQDAEKTAQSSTKAISQVIDAVNMLAQQIDTANNSPRRVVRDPKTGDIIGIETAGGMSKRVVRDPTTGDIVGVE
jgi:hypothetical protein